MGANKELFIKERIMSDNTREAYEASPFEITPTRRMVISKIGAASFHQQVKDHILSTGKGLYEYLEAVKFFGKVNEVIFGASGKDGDTEFLELVIDEIKKNGPAGLTSARGVKFELCETGTKYDYSHNPGWVALDNEIKALTEQRKQLEERLKTIPAGKQIVDAETGEIFTGPGKSSKSSFKVTIPKG